VSYEPATVVEVWAWDRFVGAVTLDPGTEHYAFEYDPAWADGGRPLSPLLLPNRRGVFVFPGLQEVTFQRLPPLLADSLPDRFGNALVDAWMAEQGVRADQITPLDRLAYAADRSMGALVFRPPAGDHEQPSAIQLAGLVDAARRALAGDLDEAPRDSLHRLIEVGTSAGGARAKAVVAYNEATGEIHSGQFDAPDGFEHWLVKFDGVGTDPTREDDPFRAGEGFGRIEMAYHLMALDAGVEMSECRLLPEGPRTHFMTKRFDRDGGRRIHLQSLNGMAALDFNLAGAHSYAQYLGVIDRLGLGADAREQAFRRIVFNVAAQNCDDHTKNLAFLLPEDGEWRLAPAFDVTHAHNPSGRWTSGHQMTVNGKRSGITVADLRELGDQFAVPGYKAAIADVAAAVGRWRDHAAAAQVAEATVAAIAADLAAAGLA
jgi:serine/threonine-protein kinase HipA